MSWGGPDKGDVKIDPSKMDDAWKKNADTHKMSHETMRAAGVEGSKRPPGHNPGGVLHQRGRLPFSYTTMALIGLGVTGLIGYGVLYSKKKPGTDAMDVAKVATNTARPEETQPRGEPPRPKK